MLPIPMIYTPTISSTVVTSNMFMSGAFGSIIYIPFDRPVEVQPFAVNNETQYKNIFVQTFQNLNNLLIEWDTTYDGAAVLSDKNDYITFDFAQIHPTIDLLSYNFYEIASRQVNGGALGFDGLTFSGTMARCDSHRENLPPYTGRQVIAFHLPPNALFTFAPYTPPYGLTVFQAKAFLYHYTDANITRILTYGASYSNVAVVLTNYFNNPI